MKGEGFLECIPNSSCKDAALLFSLDDPRLNISKIKCLELFRLAPMSLKMGDPLMFLKSLLSGPI